MFDYNRNALNPWIYGIPMLIILFFPLVHFGLFFSYDENSFLRTFDLYLEIMLLPYDFSSRYIFSIPYVGIVLAIASYAAHAHFYCVIIERLSIFVRKTRDA